MTLVVSRSNFIGDPSLLRIPFSEPSPSPVIRLSALAFQGVNDGEVLNVKSAEGATQITPGTGHSPKYRVPASGVPGYRFTPTTDPGAPDRYIPTLYSNGVGLPVYASLGVVFRVYSPANRESVVGSPLRDDYLHLVRTTTDGNKGIFITGIHDPGGNPAMQIRGSGGSGSSHIIGPILPADGSLHTASLVDHGTSGSFYVDGVLVGTTTSWVPLGSATFTSGFVCSGGDWDVIEASGYASILTAAQVKAKHDHYESLYQFRA